jgi:hypothetical protein
VNSLYEVSGEIYKTLEEIISIGYRSIDEKMTEKLKLLQDKAIEFNMTRGAMDIKNLIRAIKTYEKEKNHITNDELSKRLMALKFYSENIIMYNDTSEL